MILKPPTDCIFQSNMSASIVDVYVDSVAGVPVPLHGCWENETHLYVILDSLNTAYVYVF